MYTQIHTTRSRPNVKTETSNLFSNTKVSADSADSAIYPSVPHLFFYWQVVTADIFRSAFLLILFLLLILLPFLFLISFLLLFLPLLLLLLLLLLYCSCRPWQTCLFLSVQMVNDLLTFLRGGTKANGIQPRAKAMAKIKLFQDSITTLSLTFHQIIILYWHIYRNFTTLSKSTACYAGLLFCACRGIFFYWLLCSFWLLRPF